MHHLPVVRQSAALREGTQSLLSAEEGGAAHMRPELPRAAGRVPEAAGPVEHFAFETETRREHWEAMADLDTFFARVYGYFRERGLRCILLSRVTSLLILLFTILASYCTAEVVNWHDLLYVCRDEASCLKVELIRPMRGRPSLFMCTYLLLFTVYLGWQLLHLAVELRQLLEIRTFYNHKLALSDTQLQQVGWDEVVRRLVAYQAKSKFVIVKESLSAHDLAMRIMRRENWLVALINNDVLPLAQPLPLLGNRPLLSVTLEWALYTSLLDCMYDGQLRIRREFVADPAALRRRFVLAGLLNLALLPFVALFMAVFFFLRHAEEIHRQPGSIGARAFTPHALWCMREYNELPHVFDERIRASYEDSTKYVNSFPSRELAIVARLVTFVFGSMAAAAIAISVLNQEVLIHYRAPEAAGGHNLLWYLALASGALAVSRAFSAEPEAGAPEHWLRRVAANTHLLRPEWEGRAHERRTYGEFCAMFEYKLFTFLCEIGSCVSTPYALCCTLPAAAEQIVEFVRTTAAHVEGIGDVCACATFALPPHPGASLEAGVSITDDPAVAAAAAQANRGLKLEQSLLSFAAHHPQWTSAGGDALLANLLPFQHSQNQQIGGQEPQQYAGGSASQPGGASGCNPLLAQSNLLLAALDRRTAETSLPAPFSGSNYGVARSAYGANGYGYGGGYGSTYGGGGCSFGGGGYGVASSFIGAGQAAPLTHAPSPNASSALAAVPTHLQSLPLPGSMAGMGGMGNLPTGAGRSASLGGQLLGAVRERDANYNENAHGENLSEGGGGGHDGGGVEYAREYMSLPQPPPVCILNNN
mmetsp:Transcript_25985/g.60064  ORF Transcript_25985/g.60064 Transcript_25985/m.60064 type:complete len:817 (-) Transcript_25985:513-2963(-)